MGTTFPETFGCVFAEALHLGVPVLGNINSKNGYHEILKKEYLCNFNNIPEVIKKIEEFREKRPIVKLDEKFYIKETIKNWLKLLK